ncbi:hypothetical protein EV383_5928 [Pseudonocardia sediminis]|uniref:Uncharacterized protein n=1 Tax=Pseudonocardia sediminis TaxID=1397368 RepID=A0A4Q7V643_PSEST|nr:hypothetical protein EV383_5928 [Pseudonocardia sediminis]
MLTTTNQISPRRGVHAGYRTLGAAETGRAPGRADAG